jgi:ClpX C4-type zinc finger
MEPPPSKIYSDHYSRGWNAAMQQENYAAALDFAIKGYLVAKDIGENAHELAFLGLIRLAVEELVGAPIRKAKSRGDQKHICSFCGRNELEVKLMIGALATICESCAGEIHNNFSKAKA